jgi:hypothetical protein
VVCFFLVTTVLFLSFFLVGSVFSIVIPFRFRIAGPSGAGLPTGLTLEGIMMALCGVVVGVVYDKIILPPLQCGGGVRLLSGPPNVIDTVGRLEADLWTSSSAVTDSCGTCCILDLL